jgi:DNA-binding PucR family transcriptional regulator
VLRSAHLANAAQLLDARTLRLAGDLAPGLASDAMAVLLVPDAHRSHAALQAALAGRAAIIGPTRPWTEAQVSYRRVLHARELLPMPADESLDTDDHLVALVVTADPDALRDLRARALAPLADLRPATAERLTETLRSWFLHQGRRDDVAADLHVHAQTVRYRMTQLRELFGERLTDPNTTLELIIALSSNHAASR